MNITITTYMPSTLANGIEGALLLLEQAYPEETRDQNLRRILFAGVAGVVQTYDRRKTVEAGEKPASDLLDYVENESNPVYAAFHRQFCADDNGTHWHTWRDAVAWERRRAGCQLMREEESLDLLAVMFDAYEEGPACYENPEEYEGFIGNAIHLDDTTFQRIAEILNERRPRAEKLSGNASGVHRAESSTDKQQKPPPGLFDGLPDDSHFC